MKKSPIALAVVSALSLSLVPMLASAHGAIPAAMQSGGETSSVSPSSSVSSSFSSLDMDQDGFISRDEADKSSMLKDDFVEADADQSGSIDASELAAFETKKAGAAPADAFAALDVNNDGYLMANEIIGEKKLYQNHKSIDKDRDGWISRREYQSYKGVAITAGLTPFRDLDANKDGAVSMHEAGVDPVVSGQFTSYDRDQNGIIDRTEFSALEAAHSGVSGKMY